METSITTIRSVQEMPIDEQPRERLQRYGAESLSEAELIAIILRTGIQGQNAVETARQMIRTAGSLHQLSRMRWQDMRGVPGVASVKALTLEAVFELGRRVASAPQGERFTIRCPEDVYAHFGPRLRDERVEVFTVAFLNAAKVLIGHKMISRGGTTSTIVEPGEVFRQAMIHDAHSIIVMHNHPSGNLRPSDADIQLTRRLIEAGKLVGIALEDHLIIAGHQFVSLRSNGNLSF